MFLAVGRCSLVAEGGANRESNINIYTLLCAKWIAGEKLLYVTQGAHLGAL